MCDLKDKVVVITGAAKGIGAAIVTEVLQEGAKQVRILDVDETAGLLLQGELNKKYGVNKAKFIKCDVSIEEQFYKALDDAKQENGYIDLVINNAGVTNESSLKLIRKQIEINYIAVVNGTLKAIELMRTDNGGRGGAVINIASIAGLLPNCTPMFTYSSTKSAVIQFSACVGQEQCLNTGVRVMAICVGVTDTGLLETMHCLRKDFDAKVQSILNNYPKQTTQSVARGTVEVYQKAESATIWLVHNNEPAKDLTSTLQKANEDLIRELQRLE